MLRITTAATPQMITLKLEGKLLEPWCDETLAACDAALGNARSVRLDLHDLSFLDDAGARLLHELLTRGVTITRCSSFIAELLQQPERA